MISKNIRLLYWFNFFSDFRLYAGIAIVYFSHVTGSYALGMSVFSIIFISSALFEIPTGVFSDKIGRKNTVLIGSITSILSVVFYAIGQGFLFLAIGALIEGLSRSFFSGNNEALLYDSLRDSGKESSYHEYLGKVSSAFQVALAISTGLGGFIALLSFGYVLWISVIPQVISLFIAFRIIEPKSFEKNKGNIYNNLKKAIFEFKHNIKLRYLSLSSIISFGFSESAFQFSAAFINTLWPIWAVGLYKTASHGLGALGFHFSGKIINKFSHLKVLIWDNIIAKIMNLTALIFPTVFSPVLMALTSLGWGASTVAEGSLLQKEFTDKQRATMGSLNSFVGSLLFGIVAFLIGFVADKYGPANTLIIISIITSIQFWFYYKLYNQK